jgi:hypothetical protein
VEDIDALVETAETVGAHMVMTPTEIPVQVLSPSIASASTNMVYGNVEYAQP